DSTEMWRELLAAGVKSAALAGSGVFKDAASDLALRSAFFNQSCSNFQIVIPSFGLITGPFKLTQLHYEGPYDGEVKITLALASAGALSFVAI
ncbi:MAG: phage major tail protein, TP901-1 family, partial [Rhizomicrobium sp.]|nr:phage major tail protein, TP901-1 family [Rhizomicrobium sp.]